MEIITWGVFTLIDMQVRTNCSTGFFTPRQIIERAARRGIETIAFTDTDTIDGFRRGRMAAEEHGVKLVPAVELDCMGGLAVLGYGFQWETPNRLTEFLANRKTARENFLEEILPFLEEYLGSELTLDDFNAYHPYAIARIVAEKREPENLLDEVEKTYRWLQQLPIAVDESSLQPRDAIRLIHDAGGLAVFARPDSSPEGRDVFRMLVPCGLDGVDVLFPGQDVQYWSEQARQAGLLANAGTCFRALPGETDEPFGVPGPFADDLKWIWHNEALQ